MILSAGGSAFYDLVLEEFSAIALSRPGRIVVRSGCYLTHDNLLYRSLQAEVEQRLGLQSADTSTDAGIDTARAGRMRRDYGQDADNPVPQRWHRASTGQWGRLPPQARISMVNDQHTNLTLELGHRVEIGDLVSLGVSHPCTTFDKWQVLYVINDEGVVVDAVRTWF